MIPSAAPRPVPRLIVMRANRADHVLEVGDIGLRPCRLVRQRGAIGRAVQHLKGFGGIEAEIFRIAVVGDVAAGFEEAVDCHALFEMFAVVPAIETRLRARGRCSSTSVACLFRPSAFLLIPTC
jgi:hypothetical protein